MALRDSIGSGGLVVVSMGLSTSLEMLIVIVWKCTYEFLDLRAFFLLSSVPHLP